MVSRRNFLLATAAAGGALLIGRFAVPPPAASQLPSVARVKRKWVMIIDLERCDGCLKCTDACIETHMVPPAWAEPNRNGRQEWIKVYDLGKDLGPPGPKGNFLPTPCMQCEHAPCVKVCPVRATYHNEDGVVLIDHGRCIGCRFCIVACPYERRFFNWGEPHTEEERAKLSISDYSPEYPVPHRKGTTEKCMFCAHYTQNGKLPACVEACTKAGMKAIYFGDANEDAVSNGVDVLKFSETLASTYSFRWKEDLGTEPRVYYLPPRRK